MIKNVFVGREEELEQLERFLSEVKKGYGKAVFVTGPAGIGKTHLVEEFVRRHPEVRTLSTRCSTEDQPYESVIRLLRKYGETDRHSLVKEEKDEFEITLKKIRALENALLSREGASSINREDLFSTINDIFMDIAEHIPLLVVVDDFHLIDASSLAFFSSFLKLLPSAPIMGIAAYRDEEVSPRHPLHSVVSSENQSIHFLPLGPLNALDVMEMVEKMLGVKDMPTLFIKRLYKETRGNPLFVREVVNAIMEKEDIDRSNPYWYTEIDLSSIPLPGSLKEIILSQVKNLDHDSRKVLGFASAFGDRFNISTIERAMTKSGMLSPSRTRAAIDHLSSSRLLREDESGYFKFEYPEVRELVYRQLEDPESVHETLAETLEEMGGDVYLIARQYSLAGNLEKTVEFEEKAGDKALSSLAPVDARVHYENATSSLKKLLKNKRGKAREKMNKKMAELLVKKGDAESAIGEVSAALDSYKKAIKLFDKTGDEEKKMDAMKKMADVHRVTSRWQEASKLYREVLEMAEKYSSPKYKIEALRGIGYVHWRMGEFDRAIEKYSEALSLAEKEKEVNLIGPILIEFGNVYNEKGELEKALKYYLKSVDLLTKTKNYGELARAYNNIGDTYLQLEKWNEAFSFFKKTGAVAEKIGNKTMVGWALFNAAEALARSGRPDKAINYADGALKILERIGDAIGLSGVYKAYAIAYRLKGNWDQAMENVEKAIEYGEKAKSPYTLAEIYLEKANIYRDMGETERAEEWWEKARGIAEGIGAAILLKRIEKEKNKTT